MTPVAADFGPSTVLFQGRIDAASGTSRSPALHTRNSVPSQIGTQEQNLRVFFRRFLIVHLTPNTDMDGYLGFTPPEALALSNGYP